MKIRFTLLGLVASILVSNASAAMVARYVFTGGSASSTDAFAGSTAQTFVISGGTPLADPAQMGFSTTTEQPFLRTSGLTSTKQGAIDNNDFFAFTVTPDVGTTYPLSQLSFSFGGSNVSSGSTADAYTAYVSVQAQIGSGAFFEVAPEISRGVPYDAGNSGPQLDPYAFDLSGIPALQNTTEAVTFRFYVHSDVFVDGKIVRLDNVVLDTVPEPSMALLAVAGGALALGRRRSRA